MSGNLFTRLKLKIWQIFFSAFSIFTRNLLATWNPGGFCSNCINGFDYKYKASTFPYSSSCRAKSPSGLQFEIGRKILGMWPLLVNWVFLKIDATVQHVLFLKWQIFAPKIIILLPNKTIAAFVSADTGFIQLLPTRKIYFLRLKYCSCIKLNQWLFNYI